MLKLLNLLAYHLYYHPLDYVGQETATVSGGASVDCERTH